MGNAARALLALVAVARILVAGSRPVAACSCAGPFTPTHELEERAAIFTGLVADIRMQGGTYSATFEVERVFKGVSGEAAVVMAEENTGANCGFDFELGERYLVYAYESSAAIYSAERPGSGGLGTNGCLRTAPLEMARADLAELERALAPRLPQTGGGGTRRVP